ncbi:MAG TPA: hypothetical protein VEA99_11005 [Gemmatimonadaceae bacterium]|nr:hypothetical protein [Gemmatimonadaceae bacterium]
MFPSIRRALPGLLAAALAGCAANPTPAPAPGEPQADERGCPPVHQSLLARGPVYAPCDVDVAARPVTAPPPVSSFMSGASARERRRSCSEAMLEMVVNERGDPVPELIRVARTNDHAFAQAARQAYAQLRFSPAVKGGAVVRQVAVIHVWRGPTITLPVGSQPSPPSGPRRC